MSDYRFIDKDPAIDIVRSAIAQSGRDIEDVANCAGIRIETIKRWLFKDTRRPQNVTLELVLLELGIKRTAVWIKTGKIFKKSSSKSLKGKKLQR